MKKKLLMAAASFSVLAVGSMTYAAPAQAVVECNMLDCQAEGCVPFAGGPPPFPIHCWEWYPGQGGCWLSDECNM